MNDQVADVSKGDGTAPMKAMGFSGLKHDSGYVREEFLQKLQGERGIKVYKEMADNDPVIGAILYTVSTLLQGVTWSIEPDDEHNAEDVAAAEFVDSCAEDMDFTMDEFIDEVLSMLVYGWSFFEKIFKVRLGDKGKVPSKFDDGKIGWKRFGIRSQDTLRRWVFNDEGDVLAMVQGPSYNMGYTSSKNYDEVTIPMDKGLLFRTRAFKNNPEGRSILRNAYRPWYFKTNIESIEAIGIERDLAGLPVVWVPQELLAEGASTEEQQVLTSLKDMIKNIRNDEQAGVVMPNIYDESGNPLYKLELLTTGGRKAFDTSKIITRYEQRIAMTALADFMMLGLEKFGSFSLASEKTNMFTSALGAMLENISSTFTKHAIPQLLSLNNMSGKVRLVHGDIEDRPLSEITEFVSKLSGAGVIVPDEELEEALRKLADLPKKGGSISPIIGEEEGGREDEDMNE